MEILMSSIIDTYSRAVGLYAVPNLEARHAARMLVRHIGIFGCPSRGTHFTADVIQELMVLVGTNHLLTLAASKQENAAVENANKRSQEYLCSILFDNCVVRCVTVSAAYHDGRAQSRHWRLSCAAVVWKFYSAS